MSKEAIRQINQAQFLQPEPTPEVCRARLLPGAREEGMLVTTLAVIALLVVIVMLLFPDILRVLFRRAHACQAAEARATLMLHEVLAPPDLEQLVAQGYLSVPSPGRPGRVYRVPRKHGLVQVYDYGELTERLCVGAAIRIPDADLVLLHKLMIEASEDEYLRVANHFSPRHYTYPF